MLIAATCISALLAACGGGGDTSSSASTADAGGGGGNTVAVVPPTTEPAASAPVATAPPPSPAASEPNRATILAVRANDIVVQARETMPFADQRWGSVQCNGAQQASQELSEDGVRAAAPADGSTLRFGRVADPLRTGGTAFRITLDANDAITSSSHRCELSFPANAAQGLPRGRAFWHAFAVLLPDLAGTTDEQAIAQWHAGDTSGGMLPIYTLLLRGNTLRLVLRYDTSATPNRSTTVTSVVWSSTNWAPGQWLSFVTQALVSTNLAERPFVRTWLNGTRIVDYVGAVGYNQPDAQPYVKHGIYHWVDSSNTWDPKAPTRTILLKRPLLVADVENLYTPDLVQRLQTTE
jgi:hypothetical protein